jgi:hypothetical protein
MKYLASKQIIRSLALAGSALLLPATAAAQTWLGEPNSLAASASYAYSSADSIDGLDGYVTRHHVLLLGADYVTPIDELAVSVSLPLMAVKYDREASTGMLEHSIQRWDDGDYHLTPQDATAMVTYEFLTTQYFGWAASVGGSVPVADYAAEGYAGAGRGQAQAHFRTHITGVILPRLFGRALYEYSLVERLDKSPETRSHNLDRSRVELFLGYQITDKLGANVSTDLLFSHGGFELERYLEYSQSEQDYHDRLLKERIYQLGVGATYALTDRIDLGLAVRLFLGGDNTREANMVGLHAGWRIL